MQTILGNFALLQMHCTGALGCKMRWRVRFVQESLVIAVPLVPYPQIESATALKHSIVLLWLKFADFDHIYG